MSTEPRYTEQQATERDQSAIATRRSLGHPQHQRDRRMIITISGTPGSGKSTVGKRLARYLSYPRVDIGELRRSMARERGLSLAELNRLGESDPRTDANVDHFQKRLGKMRNKYIIEGRLSFHFIPHSIKIFLYATPRVGARRIWNQLRAQKKRNEARNLRSLADVERSIRERMRSDQLRFRTYYHLDAFQKKHYDLFLDTTKLTSQEVYTRVRDFIVDKFRVKRTRSKSLKKR